MARYFIVTGESSGDRLGALLAAELMALGHSVGGWGGSAMKDTGVDVYQDIKELKVMGWTDVVKQIPRFAKLLSNCKKHITNFKADHIILVDYGSFNLRIAKWTKRQNLKVTFYSPPKVWASRPNRIEKLKKYCDQIIVLFPFEQSYFTSNNVKTEYFGHPFCSEIAEHKADPEFHDRHQLTQKNIITILPGSRSSEVTRTLPIYLESIKDFQDYQACIACANDMKPLITKILKEHGHSDFHLIAEDDYYNLLSNSSLAICTSGTASLEVALFKIPQIVGYKTSSLNYHLAKRLILTKYISLVNLISDKEVVKELIQHELTYENLHANIIRLCKIDATSPIKKEYDGIISALYNSNCVKESIAAIIRV